MADLDELVAEFLRLQGELRETRGLDLEIERQWREELDKLMALPPSDRISAFQALEKAGELGIGLKVLLLSRAVQDLVISEHMEGIEERFRPLFAQARAEAGLGPDEHPSREDQPPQLRAVFDDYFAAWTARETEVLRSVGEKELADLRHHDPEQWQELWDAILADLRENRETRH
jgi:hypothetical protein